MQNTHTVRQVDRNLDLCVLFFTLHITKIEEYNLNYQLTLPPRNNKLIFSLIINNIFCLKILEDIAFLHISCYNRIDLLYIFFA